MPACCGSPPRSRSARCCCSRSRRPRRRRRPMWRRRFATSGRPAAVFSRHRLRRTLVAAQVALSISLLVGAGLCIRSLNAAAQMTPGFQAEGVVVGWLDLFSAGYTSRRGPRLLRARARSRARAFPASNRCRSAAAFRSASWAAASPTSPSKATPPRDDDPQGVGLNNVGPDYATTMRIPIVAGRDLSTRRRRRSAARSR